MSTITLTAQIEDGISRFYPTSSFNSWYIEQNQDFERSFELYEYPRDPDSGGEDYFTERYYTLEQAYKAAQELT